MPYGKSVTEEMPVDEPYSGSVEVEYDLTPPAAEGPGEGQGEELPALELDDDNFMYSDQLKPLEVDPDKGNRGKLARRGARAMTGWCSLTCSLEKLAESS